MMISPDWYIEEQKDKKYKDLLKEKEKLLKEIKAFEDDKIPESEYMIDPSPEVRYQCNLKYLGKLCELISDKYNKEVVWGKENNN